ncbi:MAG: MFS transporter [bacterium]
MKEGPQSSLSGGNKDGTFTAGRRSHMILAVLFLIYMSDYADRMVVAGIIDYIKRDWHISDAQAGWLMSIVLIFITVFSVPASVLVDRWSRRKMVAIMTFIWSLATLACKFATGYWQLLAARAFIGLGEAGYASGGTALLSGAYPESKRSMVLGIFNASIPVGIGIGMAFGGIIARNWGWQNAFGLVAIPGMALAIIAWFLPDYKSVHQESGKYREVSVSNVIADVKNLLRVPSLTLTYVAFAMNVSCTTAIATWLPMYFERTGLADSGGGGALATLVMGMIIVGAPLGGFLADRWQKRRDNARMVFPALTSFAAASILVIAFSLPGEFVQLPLLTVYGILVTCFIAPALAITQDVVHPGMRGLSMGMCVLLQHVLGDIWSPPLIGALSDILNLQMAVMFIPLYGLVAAALFYAGAKFYVRDFSHVERVALEAEKPSA